MPTIPRLRAALLLASALALSACQATEPVRTKEKWDESMPPKVATKAAAPKGKPALVLTGAQGRPGEIVTVTAKLNSGGAQIAGTQNDIVVDPTQVAIVADSGGRPDCAANRQLRKEGTAFSFLPKDCRNNCTTVRALVLSLGNVDAIANGSALYSCKVRIAPQARPGAHKLSVERVGFSSPKGQAIDGGSEDGAITVAK